MDTTLLDRFRDPALARELSGTIAALAAKLAADGRGMRLMEVCGTHTMAIAKSGMRAILPANIELISGPGCPVCVSSNHDIDKVVALTRLGELFTADVTVVSFGDMLRVPGSSTSLQKRKAAGAKVEVVYSPLDALQMASAHPDRQFVFVAVGFETTAPLTAATIQRATQLGLDNFTILTIHKRIPPALTALASDAEVSLDALLLPGHVATILGMEPFGFLAEEFGIPAVVCGFEPVDILYAINMLLLQLNSGCAEVQSAYGRAVSRAGNPKARAALNAVFEVDDADWRGLGQIADSGYRLNAAHRHFDAEQRFDLELQTEPEVQSPGCKCGEVLRGVLSPASCPLYGRVCSPENPIGPCMVSSEGSCAAFYRYRIGA